MKLKSSSKKVTILLATVLLFFNMTVVTVAAISEKLTQDLSLSANKSVYQLEDQIELTVSAASSQSTEVSFDLPDGLDFNKTQTEKMYAATSNVVVKEEADISDANNQVVSETKKTLNANGETIDSSGNVSQNVDDSTNPVNQTPLPNVTKSEDEVNQRLVITYYQKQREVVLKNYTGSALEKKNIALTASQLGDYQLQLKQKTADNLLASAILNLTVAEEQTEAPSTDVTNSSADTTSVFEDSKEETSESSSTENSIDKPQSSPSRKDSEPITVDPGWTGVVKTTYASFKIYNDYTAYYGFASPYKDAESGNIFQTDTYIQDKDGKRVDYIYHNGDNKTQEMVYVTESQFQLLPLPHNELKYTKIKVGPVAVVETQLVDAADASKGTKIQAVGYAKANSGLISSEHDEFKVTATLTPNVAEGTVEYSTKFERLRSNGFLDSSAYGDNIGFVKIIDTELNKNDAVDLHYIALNEGMSIKSDPYQVTFNFQDVSNPDSKATNWNAGTFYTTGFLGSGGVTEPKDYFSGWGESTGAEANSGKPGDVILTSKDSGVAMKWKVDPLKKGSSKVLSYKIYLGVPTPPVINVEKPEYDAVITDNVKVAGTWHDIDSPWVDLSYSVDSGDLVNFGTKVENPILGTDNKWNLDVKAMDIGIGTHNVSFYASDSSGATSKIAETTINVRSDEGYLFSKTLTKTGNAHQTIVGDIIHYHINLENSSGHDWTTGIQDEIPKEADGLTVKKDTIAGTAADGTPIRYGGMPSDKGSFTVSDGLIYFMGLTVKDGESIRLEFDAIVNENATGKKTLTNIATSNIINKTNAERKITAQVDLPGTMIEHLPTPDIQKTYVDPNKTEDGDSIEGNVLDYSIHIGNKLSGIAPCSDQDLTWYSMTATDELPDGLSYVDGSIQIFDNKGTDITSTANVEDGNLVYQTQENMIMVGLQTLADKDFIDIKFKAKIAEGTAGTSITNLVTTDGLNFEGTKIGGTASSTIKQVVEKKKLPEIDMTNQEETTTIKDYVIKGTWEDENNPTDTLYYQIDNGTPEILEKDANNPKPGEMHDWTYTIPAKKFTTGDHTVTVYVVGKDGSQSETDSVLLHLSGALSFKATPPAKAQFSTTKIPNQATFVKRASAWEITIEDTLGKDSQWRLDATLQDEFKDATTNKVLKNGLVFVDEKGNENPLSPGEAAEIATGKVDSEVDFPIKWQDNQGLLMKVDSGSFAGNYTGTIDWTLIDAP